MAYNAIEVHNLGKRYRIGLEDEQHDTLFGLVKSWMASPIENYRRLKKLSSFAQDEEGDDIIWALRDASFSVKRGEVVGIIGHNGAGKSTLLKVLSRITEPTNGHIDVRGRIASLLEVGTGFHPELTGRENVYLNGTIMGMSKAEVDRKFDEIVDFSGVRKFIDTPVKRYSSGMKVRLGFAVAAHLEPEILLVDEVLAVGDAGFQRKCLGKMNEVTEEGRTVLFVSHDMAAVSKLCPRTIMLHEGRIAMDGPTSEVIMKYLKLAGDEDDTQGDYNASPEHLKKVSSASDSLDITGVRFLDEAGRPLEVTRTGDTVVLQIDYYAHRTIDRPAFNVVFADHRGSELMRLSTMPISGFAIDQIEGEGTIELTIDHLPFTGGRYGLMVGASRPGIEWMIPLTQVFMFDIYPHDVYGSGRALSNDKGYFTTAHRWNMQSEAVSSSP